MASQERRPSAPAAITLEGGSGSASVSVHTIQSTVSKSSEGHGPEAPQSSTATAIPSLTGIRVSTTASFSPTPRRGSFKAKHVANAGRAAKKLVSRTIKGGIRTTRSVVHSSIQTFRNHTEGEEKDDDSLSSTSEFIHTTSDTKAVLQDIEKLAQKSGTNSEQERFKVVPSYAYPKTKLNREELRQEMNKPSSYYHDLRPKTILRHDSHLSLSDRDNTQSHGSMEEGGHRHRSALHPTVLGSFYLEILQCFGIPRPDLIKETSAFCLAVCGPHAFKTDIMPPVANPMWLSKMRRAVIFPLHEAYARVYLGVFAYKADGRDGFIGRVVMDMARLRPGCTYDITLPLRQSSQVYSRQKRGAIRFRYHLEWHEERQAILSYLPFRKTDPSGIEPQPRSPFKLQFQPHESVTVRCCDNRAFQNVARVVHGHDMPGKFSMKLVKATIREITLYQIHIIRYLRKQQLQDLIDWRYPVISAFVFGAWMHSVFWVGDIRYVPGHIVTYLLLHIWKNYALYVVDGQHDKGFSAPTFEEMAKCLIVGGGRPRRRRCIEPLAMERKVPGDQAESALQHFDEAETVVDDEDERDEMDGPDLRAGDRRPTKHSQSQPSLPAIAMAFRDGVPRTEGRSTRYLFKSSNQNRVFTGSAAVDFLVAQGYAATRIEAVALGLRLQKELKVFEHVSRKNDFKDRPEQYYVFLKFDTSEYVFKTHRPWFRRVFNWLRFRQTISPAEAHWEFPFATGADHPLFTVKESLVIRSKESRNLLQTMNQQEEMEDVDALGVTDYNRRRRANMTGLPSGSGHNSSKSESDAKSDQDGSVSEDESKTRNRILSDAVDIEVELIQSDDEQDEIGEFVIEEMGNVEVKVLPKPPNQDVNVDAKNDVTIADQMAETRHKVHQMFGHLFHDRVYKLSLMGDVRRRESRIISRLGSSRGVVPSRPTRRLRNRSPLRSAVNAATASSNITSTSTLRGSHAPKRQLTPFWGRNKAAFDLNSIDDPEKTHRLALSSRKDEYDRLLGIGKYSHNNVIVSKVAVIVQPIVEIAQLFLSVIRTIFNLFTWRDPFLTFWAVMFGTILVVVLHLFPWRIALGVGGIALTGPQNWVFRILKERKNGGPIKHNLDLSVKKRKPRNHSAEDIERFEYFSSFAPDNRPITDELLDKSEYKEVAVPHTPLLYRRFYDWPPEPAYARVWSCAPPQNDPRAERLLEDDEFDLYEGNQEQTTLDDSDRVRGPLWTQPGRNIVRGVKSVVPKNLRRRRSPMGRLESLPEN